MALALMNLNGINITEIVEQTNAQLLILTMTLHGGILENSGALS
jgi:hypothetical protein